MAGVKGRSGRKSNTDEAKRLRVIEKAWDLVEETLISDNPAKFIIAKDIVLKDITQKVKGDGFETNIHLTNIRALIESANDRDNDRTTESPKRTEDLVR